MHYPPYCGMKSLLTHRTFTNTEIDQYRRPISGIARPFSRGACYEIMSYKV